MMHPWPRLAALATLLGSLFLANIVRAHARYIRSEPPTDAIVAQSPVKVQIWFSQELRVRGSQIAVTDQSGNPVDDGSPQVGFDDPKRMEVALRPVGDGSYQVAWRAISNEDGDTSEGNFTFRVSAAVGNNSLLAEPALIWIGVGVLIVIAAGLLVGQRRRSRVGAVR